MTDKEELKKAFTDGVMNSYLWDIQTLDSIFETWYTENYENHPITPEKEILDYLSKRSGMKFKHTPSNFRPIKARLNDGYTSDDLRKVIDNMVTEWGNTEMKKYLRPITLFRASKIDSYIGRTVRKPVSEMTDEELRKL